MGSVHRHSLLRADAEQQRRIDEAMPTLRRRYTGSEHLRRLDRPSPPLRLQPTPGQNKGYGQQTKDER